MRKTRGLGGIRSALAVAGLALTVTADAGLLSKLNVFRYFSKKSRVETLLITGNIARSRLLAEMIQFKTGQPVLLISPSASGEQLYFLPAADEAGAIETAKYVEFIDYLHPERIVFLGGPQYVPQQFVDQVKDRYPSLMVTGDDWTKNAEALGKIFRVRKLARRYAELLQQIEAAPTAPRTSSVPGAPSEPAAPLPPPPPAVR
ncbi:MAG: hypothetical protein GXP31_10745 [Kiritimatiellaeota bacterium]|nr:hypothetical protein [Kiritimatiellota bacterium]